MRYSSFMASFLLSRFASVVLPPSVLKSNLIQLNSSFSTECVFNLLQTRKNTNTLSHTRTIGTKTVPKQTHNSIGKVVR